MSVAEAVPETNWTLSAQDIRLLYAIVTRDSGLAAEAREEFQRTTAASGGFANLHRPVQRQAQMGGQNILKI